MCPGWVVRPRWTSQHPHRSAAAGVFGPVLRAAADGVERVLGGAPSVRRRLARATLDEDCPRLPDRAGAVGPGRVRRGRGVLPAHHPQRRRRHRVVTAAVRRGVRERRAAPGQPTDPPGDAARAPGAGGVPDRGRAPGPRRRGRGEPGRRPRPRRTTERRRAVRATSPRAGRGAHRQPGRPRLRRPGRAHRAARRRAVRRGRRGRGRARHAARRRAARPGRRRPRGRPPGADRGRRAQGGPDDGAGRLPGPPGDRGLRLLARPGRAAADDHPRQRRGTDERTQLPADCGSCCWPRAGATNAATCPGGCWSR